jgi:hypothetical protein
MTSPVGGPPHCSSRSRSKQEPEAFVVSVIVDHESPTCLCTQTDAAIEDLPSGDAGGDDGATYGICAPILCSKFLFQRHSYSRVVDFGAVALADIIVVARRKLRGAIG